MATGGLRLVMRVLPRHTRCMHGPSQSETRPGKAGRRLANHIGKRELVIHTAKKNGAIKRSPIYLISLT